MIQDLRMRDTPPKVDGSIVAQNSLIPLGTFLVLLVKQVLSCSSSLWLPCVLVKWNIKMSDTSQLKYPVWLWLYKWPSHFTSEGYTLIPLVRFCTNSTSAPSLIPELEQGLWDWAWGHSWHVHSNCSSTWKEQDLSRGYLGLCFHLLSGLTASHGDQTEAGPWVCWASLLPLVNKLWQTLTHSSAVTFVFP